MSKEKEFLKSLKEDIQKYKEVLNKTKKSSDKKSSSKSKLYLTRNEANSVNTTVLDVLKKSGLAGKKRLTKKKKNKNKPKKKRTIKK